MQGWLTAPAQPTARHRARFTAYLGSALILALPLAVAFGSLAAWQVHGINITATDALVALLVALPRPAATRDGAAASDSMCHGRPLRWPLALTPYQTLLMSLVALIALMALSLAWATDRVLVLKEVLKWGEALAVLAVAPRWLRRPGMVAGVVAMVLAVAVAEACLGGLQATVFVGTQHVAADRGVRVIGTYGQPNPYAGALNLALPLALALLGWARGSTRWLLLATAGALLAALVLAQSRGALLGLCGAVLGMAWLGWPTLRRWLTGSVATAGAGIALLVATGRLAGNQLLAKLGWRPLTDAALSANITDANFSTVERLAHWAAAWRMFVAHPLTGVGAGNYAVAYATYAVPRWPLPLGHAHNLYLHMLAELGIGGLLGYLAVVAASGWLLLHAWQQAQPDHAHAPASPHANTNSAAIVPAPFRVLRGLSRISRPALATSTTRWLVLGIFGMQIAMILHNGFDDLTTHNLLAGWALLLACSQTHPPDRLIEVQTPKSEG